MHTRTAYFVPARTVFAAGLLACCGLASGAEDITLDAHCAPRLTSRQQVLFDKAGAGTDVLRDFLFMRPFPHQADVYDTAVWAEAVRKQQSGCLDALSSRSPANVAKADAAPR